MANAVVANYLTPSNADHFNAVWKLSRAMKKAGWIYKSSGDATNKDTSGTASSDKWGGNADPFADTIPTLGNGSWWCAQGPSILKVPITSAASGTFARGENVTQGTTGAKGEMLGVVFDSGGLTGWAVIAPRVDGSGGDPHGWDHTHVITGDVSGATLTPSSTVLEYANQVVLWKGTDLLSGSVYFQTIETVGENTSQFSYLAINAAGCTSSIAPGGGGTGNGFPATGSWVALGTGGSQSGSKWIGTSNATPAAIGRVQIGVANATPASGVTGDGSLFIAFGNPGTDASHYFGWVIQRLDDTEDGDVSVYVTGYGSNVSQSSSVYNQAGTTFSTNFDPWNGFSWGRSTSGTIAPSTYIKAWRKRGAGAGDAYVPCELAGLSVYGNGTAIETKVMQLNSGEPEKVASDPTTTTYVGEAIWCVCASLSGQRVRKGTMRWVLVVPTGNGSDTWKSKTLIQLSNAVASAWVLGPWDGATAPANS